MREIAHSGKHHTVPKHEATQDGAEIAQRDKYGGFHFSTSFFGWLVANSVAVLLISLLSALGSAVALTANTAAEGLANNAATVGIAGAVLLLITLGIAYYAGGYVAGRMSRFDGGRQGAGVWVIGIAVTILLGLAGALLGANFNLIQQLNLPSLPINGESFTIGGLVTLLLILAVSLIAAIGGGKAGRRYHDRVDAAGLTDQQ